MSSLTGSNPALKRRESGQRQNRTKVDFSTNKAESLACPLEANASETVLKKFSKIQFVGLDKESLFYAVVLKFLFHRINLITIGKSS